MKSGPGPQLLFHQFRTQQLGGQHLNLYYRYGIIPGLGEIPGTIAQSAKLLRQAKPVYPQLAKLARIQGIVKLHALETEIDVKFMLSP